MCFEQLAAAYSPSRTPYFPLFSALLLQFVDSSQKRSPHLVPYEVVDLRIKEANRESAMEFIKALQLFGIFLEPPVLEHDEGNVDLLEL